MSGWITHLMIADILLENHPRLNRRGFCVGSIAPDCNIENEDWTAFTPPREITHWMRGEKKNTADYEAFFETHIRPIQHLPLSDEALAFMLGYYAHLVTDAEFDTFIRNPDRVAKVWERLRANPVLASMAEGLPETWEAAKQLIPRKAHNLQMQTLEAVYLREHPDSGYLTEIIALKEFPDYLNYMPAGCIARKTAIMGVIPPLDPSAPAPVTISQEELDDFVRSASTLISERFCAAFPNP